MKLTGNCSVQLQLKVFFGTCGGLKHVTFEKNENGDRIARIEFLTVASVSTALGLDGEEQTLWHVLNVYNAARQHMHHINSAHSAAYTDLQTGTQLGDRRLKISRAICVDPEKKKMVQTDIDRVLAVTMRHYCLPRTLKRILSHIM